MKKYYEILKKIKTDLSQNIKNYSILLVELQNYNYVKMVEQESKLNIIKQYENKIIELLTNEEKLMEVDNDKYLILVNNNHISGLVDFLTLVTLPLGDEYISIKSKTGIYNIKENDTAEEMIENVSLALSTIENTITNNIVYDEQLKQKNIIKQKIISYFISAIYNDEFEVYYQPKINLNTNTLCGSEALVRWRKNNQIISPADFIPVLEAENLICQLDFHVLELVCKDITNWLNEGIIPVKTSINFSKNNLKNPNFSNNIIELLNTYGINPELIEVELTETSDVVDYKTIVNFVESMKLNNINVSIDDFGTGTSTLGLIKYLSDSTIKIDKSFVDNIQNKKDAILVKSIIELAANLGMDVIAEGTETKEQIDILYQLGCEKIQGYYFDKPLPKDDYVKRLENINNCYQKQFSLLTYK